METKWFGKKLNINYITEQAAMFFCAFFELYAVEVHRVCV